MDWAFTRTSGVRPHFSPTTPIIHNIKSSSSGQNNNITSEIATKPLLLAYRIAMKLAKAYQYWLL